MFWAPIPSNMPADRTIIGELLLQLKAYVVFVAQHKGKLIQLYKLEPNMVGFVWIKPR